MTCVTKGRAVILGDGVSTDQIIAGKYCRMADPKELAVHVFEGAGYSGKNWYGTIILAGKNFGCGSSREQAPLALKAAGVRAIAAVSFGRIFFRNAINIGLPVVCLPESAKPVREGDVLSLDFKRGTIRNRTMEIIRSQPPPEFLIRILQAGGLVPYVQAVLSIGDKGPKG